jgi:hypothetical protein
MLRRMSLLRLLFPEPCGPDNFKHRRAGGVKAANEVFTNQG